MRTFVETEKGKVFFQNFNRARKFARKNSITQIFCSIENYIHTEYVEHRAVKTFFETKLFTYSV